MPLYFGDFLSSTSEWSGEEMALYLLLLAHQWALGSLPSEYEKLCRLCRWNEKLFSRCWEQVAVKFEERDGRLYNPRLESHRQKSHEVSAKRAESGAKGGKAKAEHMRSKGVANASNLLEQPVSKRHDFAVANSYHLNYTKLNKNEEVGAYQGEEVGTSEGDEGRDTGIHAHD